MTWTASRTWVAGEVVTAAIMNAQIRDNFDAIGDPWTTYTPAWTGSTTNPTLGNGTITARYSSAGKRNQGTIVVTMGSTTAYGSGFYAFGLPVAARDPNHLLVTGYAVGLNIPAIGRGSASVNFALYRTDTGVVLGSTSGLANTHRVQAHFAYEAA